MTNALIGYCYVIAAVLFILSLKWMSEVQTSRRGNWAGSLGMLIAVLTTLIAYRTQHLDMIILAVAVGTLIGIPIALKLPMTAVPQRTAMSHAFGSLAVALVGTAEYYQRLPGIDTFAMAVLAAEMILGYLTFTGSTIAFLKLQEMISGKPLIYKGRNVISALVVLFAVSAAVGLVLQPNQTLLLPVLVAAALLFGFLLVMGIGGADMPTVIAILNSYAGLSAAALGFVLDNQLLIVAGTLDGASGLILAILMCKAMNRSFANVLFGGFGATSTQPGQQVTGEIKPVSVEDAYLILEGASSVVFVPGYGLAVSQAQQAVRELGEVLQKHGVEVLYGIHPVAGRMPGHMNVLLAEANVPYDELLEADAVNPKMPNTDVSVVIGANDVVNPAAREDPTSPLWGMPIIEVDKSRTVIVLKRSMRPGFAGVENPLFFKPNTRMLFGDAKASIQALIAEFSQE
ncbi:MAG TPA: NAD(P)(+) transhydrogenase (Re/Si-specific) subunit beta [bacterium]|nr:NAD(P)(+) transhydrogenase (Re/Si-specific) subunit beta [bacterium]HPR87294.1 NAD(P)(+) transhydrogenase (Re/Si-specific) subunit beta [bacterium]